MGSDALCPAPVADFEQVTLLVQAVIAGIGVAVVQRYLVEQEVADGRLVVPVLQPFRIERGYFLCRPATRPCSPVMHDFQTWILEQAGRDGRSAFSAAARPATALPKGR